MRRTRPRRPGRLCRLAPPAHVPAAAPAARAARAPRRAGDSPASARRPWPPRAAPRPPAPWHAPRPGRRLHAGSWGGSVAHTPLATYLGTNMGLSMGCGAASALDASDSVSDSVSVSVSVSVPGSSGAAPSVTAGGGRAGPRAWGPDTGANPDGRGAGSAGSAGCGCGDAAAAGAGAGSSSESVSARVSEAPHSTVHTIFTQVLGRLLCARVLSGLRQLNSARAPLDRHAGRRRRLDCMARQRRRGDLLHLLLGHLGHIRVRLVVDLGRRCLPGAVTSRGTRHARAAHAVASSRRRSLRMYCLVEVCTTNSTSLTRGGNAPSGWPLPPRRRPTARGCSAQGAHPTGQSRAGRAR